MKKFSQIIVASLILILTFVIMGCEDSTEIRVASFTEITSPGSNNYGLRINFSQDKRLEEKVYDVQILSSKILEVIFWEENSNKVTLNIDEKDAWISLTSLVVAANNKPNTETFVSLKEAVTKVYLFNSEQSVKLTFRVVAGDEEDNSAKTGKILVGGEPISEEFSLFIK